MAKVETFVGLLSYTAQKLIIGETAFGDIVQDLKCGRERKPYLAAVVDNRLNKHVKELVEALGVDEPPVNGAPETEERSDTFETE